MPGMPWSQRNKLITAGTTLAGWQADAISAGMHIDQMNIRIDPTEEGDPGSTIVFVWDTEAEEFLVDTAGG